jgi:hypothetical protein
MPFPQKTQVARCIAPVDPKRFKGSRCWWGQRSHGDPSDGAARKTDIWPKVSMSTFM